MLCTYKDSLLYSRVRCFWRTFFKRNVIFFNILLAGTKWRTKQISTWAKLHMVCTYKNLENEAPRNVIVCPFVVSTLIACWRKGMQIEIPRSSACDLLCRPYVVCLFELGVFGWPWCFESTLTVGQVHRANCRLCVSCSYISGRLHPFSAGTGPACSPNADGPERRSVAMATIRYIVRPGAWKESVYFIPDFFRWSQKRCVRRLL